jgi:hypothetical protein
VDDSSGDSQLRLGIPAAVASIRVDGIRVFRTYDDDDGPMLVVTDGDTTVEFLCGFSRQSKATVQGARRLNDAAHAHFQHIKGQVR